MSKADLERVARAMALTEDEDYMEDHARYDMLARAAIEAIRVPSEAMLAVQVYQADLGSGEPHFIGSETKVIRADAAMWTAMIDAILEEG